MKDREVVNSAWLTAGEGLSLAGLLLALVSVVWRERRLWSRGDMALGVEGRLGVVEPDLLASSRRPLFCFTLCSWWLEVKLLPLSDPEEEEEEVVEEEEDEEEDEEEAVPLPEELELSPGCGAILG